MKRFALILFSSIIICSKSKAQAFFTFQDSVCNNTLITLHDSSKNALTYCWSFDSLNINGNITSVNLGNFNHSMNYPLGGRLVEDGGNYYLFSTQYQSNNLVRWDLGTNPLNTTPINSAIITNVLPGSYNEDIEFIKENGNWYGIADGGTTGAGILERLDFGIAITNTTPTVSTLAVTLGNWAHQLNIFKNGSNYVGFLVCRGNGNIQRLDFGSSIINTPTLTTLTSTGNPNTNFAMENENGNWYMVFVSNTLIPTSLVKLSFGTNLLNNSPIVTTIGNPNNIVNGPRAIKLFKTCNQLIGIINNQSNHNGLLGDVLQLNFAGGSINNTITTTSLNASSLGWDLFWNQTSNVFWANNAYHFFAFDGLDSAIVRVDIPVSGYTAPISFTQNPTITYNSSGQHTLQLLTNFGNVNQSYYCDAAHTFFPNITTNHDTAICAGNTVHLVANSIGTMVWNATNGFSCNGCTQTNFSGATTTNYYISSTLNSCVAHDTIRISVQPLPTLTVVSPVSVCQADTIRLSANSNASVSWNPTAGLSCGNCLQPLAQVVSNQVYHITAGITGCAITDSVIINIKPLPTLTVSNDTEVCYGNTISLFANSNGIISWYLLAGIVCNNCSQVGFMDSVNTTFYVKTVGANGCQSHDSVKIKVDRKIPFPRLNDTTICAGATLNIVLNNAPQYTWLPTINCGICNPVLLSPTNNTTYTIIETNGKCIDSTHFKINLRKVVVNAGNDTLIAQNTTAQLHASGAANYIWQSNPSLSNIVINNPVASPITTTTYVVTGNDNFGCTATDTVVVFVSALCGSIIAPNAFSPNADGKNDVFKLLTTDFASIKYFRIYNRWGQKVFETTNINEGWDGMFNNQLQPLDVFVYYVQLDCPMQNNPIIKGNITLVR